MNSELSEKEQQRLALAIGLVLVSTRWRALSKDSYIVGM